MPGFFMGGGMFDSNWELIDGEAAHTIEVLNYSNTVNVIEGLVHLLMHQHRGLDGTCSHSPNENVLREFHRTATLFLLEHPGAYRDCPVVVRTGDKIVHTPPPAEEVVAHIETFFGEILSRWADHQPQEIGAYTLWMINWIHPFKNGNGRTARAFCYACMSLKLGFVLPGRPTIIDLIMQDPDEYYAALGVADQSFKEVGEPDLTPMIDLVDRLLADQLSSIPNVG